MTSTNGTAGNRQFEALRRGRTCLATLLGIIGAVANTGCLDRPIETTTPETYNAYITRYKTTKIDKIDLLFMVDNSLSMADKQKVLAAAVPQLLRRLTSPDCVDPNNPSAPPVAMADPTSPCANPQYVREFDPVSDIHIGVVTSSLGDFGGSSCDDRSRNPDGSLNPTFAHERARDDKAYLLGALPRASSLNSPFLTWSPDDANNFATHIGPKEAEFRNFVTTAGEHGCGFEMNLEAWYRFLIDPVPPVSVEAVVNADKSGGYTLRSAEVDPNVITQRKQFLRPDSLLAIVMLTDENDCSLKDSRAAFFLTGAGAGKMKGASAACKINPNDRCCYSCDFDAPPAGCAVETNCTGPNPTVDESNLRCFDQKRRYGWDFLFPTARYVNALKLKTICPHQNYGTLDCECTEEKSRGITDCVAGPSFKNPIFDPEYAGTGYQGDARTDAQLVFLTGIVGVPWQDIAEEDTLAPGVDLRYKLASKIKWEYLLPAADGTPPLDPLMIEQVEPRTGKHPVTHEPIGLPTSETQRELNSINWHEVQGGKKELQFACVFDITQQLSDEPVVPRNCETPCADGDEACKNLSSACTCTGTAPKEAGAPLVYPKSPHCQAPNGAYGNIQYAAKAYPGTRQLEVLRGHNQTAPDNSVVASICPKELDWGKRTSRGYGYNPAVQALVDRLKTKLTAACLPRPLIPEDGKLPCSVMEAVPSTSEWAACVAKQREIVEPPIRDAVLRGMRDEGLCDVLGQPPCSNFTVCQLKELKDTETSNALTQCQTASNYETNSPVPGFCYVDPANNIGTANVVNACPSERKRMLRIVGDNDKLRAPAPNSWTFIACAGSPHEKSKK